MNDGATPLFIAAQNGHEDVVRLLLDSGASVDKPDQLGRTPLLMAVINQHVGVAEMLLKKGANPKYKDGDGNFAMKVALVESIDGRILDLLLDHKTGIHPDPKHRVDMGTVNYLYNPMHAHKPSAAVVPDTYKLGGRGRCRRKTRRRKTRRRKTRRRKTRRRKTRRRKTCRRKTRSLRK